MRKLLLLLAWLLCLGGWARLYSQAITQTPPARRIHIVGADGRPLSGLRCGGSAISAGAAIYQLCRVAKRPYLVRFELGNDRAVALAVRDTARAIRAATRHPGGDLIVLVEGAGRFVRARATRLDVLAPAAAREVVGLAWVGDHLEWTERRGRLCRSAKGGGGPVRCRALVRPPETDAIKAWVECGLRRERRWLAFWLRAPKAPAAGARFELLVGPVDEAPHGRWSRVIPAAWRNDLPRHRVLVGDAAGLVRAPGRVRPLERRGGRWQPLALPRTARPDDRVAFDYRLEPSGRLRALPRVDRLRAVRVGAAWIALSADAEPLLTRDVAGKRTRGEPLAARFWLAEGFRLLPRLEGGFYVIGRAGRAFTVTDDKLRRQRTLTFFERLGQLFVDDDRKRAAGFFDNLRWLKMASVPFILLVLPVFFLPLAMLAYRRRVAGKKPGTLVPLLVYIVGCGGLGVWFWQLTGYI